MQYRLNAMDLDGTLNNDEKWITPRTKQALMRSQEAGIRLVLASARPSPGLFKERDALDLQGHGGILMSYNGGRIVDAATGKVLFETAMELPQAKEILRQLKALPVTPILDDGTQFYVEILPASINKGQGLLQICKLLDIPAEETVAFGDAENDIPMLKAAGLGVAMENATEATKAAADRVTLSNNCDGIAAVVETFL